MTTPLAVRFWAKVDTSGGMLACWPWLGATVGKGYGHVLVGARMVKAHRVALALSGVDVPDDRQVLHTCDNPPCCNPAHLSTGTGGDNVRNMVAKDRQPAHMRPRAHCRRGHPFTDDNVRFDRGWQVCRVCSAAYKRDRRARLARPRLDVSTADLGVGARGDARAEPEVPGASSRRRSVSPHGAAVETTSAGRTSTG